ncbi:GlxA family transcriptional regulator [Pseudomonas anguilliseptica]|uniref:Transcriptional regulator, AraC family with amidase-like domain n=1 Tax=Pseudomonas anguilliseptica TaxID=53406 RepID=A0A1H5C9B9_PSEAG|nr:helix-turn-helix domain-containing protein [Pseudomonas anguilliseptica]SED63226.1 transcriptional regulator, AraC family with amidase-like domain [Pseudomonas anguilliseptica]
MNVTLLMANQCSSTSVAAALEFFETANVLQHYAQDKQARQQAGVAPLFRLHTASMDGQSVACTGGLRLTPDLAVAELPMGELIVVPGFMFNILGVLPQLGSMIDWLRQQHEQGSYIASLCTGAFVTAQTGLLDGRNATTHWAFSEQFARRFPLVRLHPERTVTDDGQLLCSGGSTSSSDLLLHLIRKFASPQLAAECAKKLLVDVVARSQAPYSSTTFKKGHTDAEILKVQIWLENHLTSHVLLEQMAEHFGLSQRNLIRRFKDATEQTPMQYLQELRIEKAKLLLESSQAAFDQITLQVGYEDANSFRRLFKQRVGLAPSAYRKRFASKAP